MQHTQLIISLGESLRAIRRERGLTLLELATMCEMSEKHLGQIERGKGNATIGLLENIACKLDVQMQDLLPQRNALTRDEMLAELQKLFAQSNDKELLRLYRVVKACVE